MGLGYLGQGDRISAENEFAEALRLNLNHIWAAALLSQIKDGTIVTLTK